jgi:hypothetical protein
MPRIFNRIVIFHVQGEIYDNKTDPETIIKNYHWQTRNNIDGKLQIVANHKDTRGRITKMVYLPKIYPWHKPDKELFLI